MRLERNFAAASAEKFKLIRLGSGSGDPEAFCGGGDIIELRLQKRRRKTDRLALAELDCCRVGRKDAQAPIRPHWISDQSPKFRITRCFVHQSALRSVALGRQANARA